MILGQMDWGWMITDVEHVGTAPGGEIEMYEYRVRLDFHSLSD